MGKHADELRLISYHEAGHAVVAHELGIEVAEVSTTTRFLASLPCGDAAYNRRRSVLPPATVGPPWRNIFMLS